MPGRRLTRLPRALPRAGRRLGGCLVLASAWLVLAGCATSPPRNPDNLCSIFAEKRGWFRAARESAERWGVPEAVQLAIVHQESHFRADARPARSHLLGFVPWRRPSSAYGYGQVKDDTWSDYQRATERRGADRDDFADVADFIGWYGDRIHRLTGVARDDAHRLYLAYHEGPTGFQRGDFAGKAWLLDVARRVESRARRYEVQYAACREDLERPRGFWPF